VGQLLINTPPVDCCLSSEELRAWARQRAAGSQIEEVTCGQFVGVSYESIDSEGTYWREWLLTLAELVLIVTYQCEQHFRDHDRAALETMVSSLSDARP
jgi:hypothetical protein